AALGVRQVGVFLNRTSEIAHILLGESFACQDLLDGCIGLRTNLALRGDQRRVLSTAQVKLLLDTRRRLRLLHGRQRFLHRCWRFLHRCRRFLHGRWWLLHGRQRFLHGRWWLLHR